MTIEKLAQMSQKEFTAIRKEMSEEFASVREEMRQGFSAMREEMATKEELRVEIGGLRADMEEGFQEVKATFKTVIEKVDAIARDVSQLRGLPIRVARLERKVFGKHE